MKTIAYDAAIKIAGLLPLAQREINKTIEPLAPEFATMTRYQLAAVIQALHAHWHRGAAWKENQILSEGYIYSPEHESLLDFYNPQTHTLVKKEI